MRTTLSTLAITVAGALIAAPALATVPTTVPTTDLDPATLARGADVAIPYVDGTTFVDGDRRVPLGGKYAWLLGASGDGHLVAVNAGNTKIRRIDAAGTASTLIRTPNAASVHLSRNGRKIVVTGVTGGKAQPRTVYSATTGQRLQRRTFAHYPTTLGMKGSKVLFSTSERGTFSWNTRTDRVKKVTRRFASYAGVHNNLLASYTADPYEGGCTVLSTISRPGRTIWRSCKERVESVSPDGRLIATVDLLSDGVGPREVTVRTVSGTRLAHYRTSQWFGAITWEDDDTILLDVNAKVEAAIVRCDLTECENATDPEPTPDL